MRARLLMTTVAAVLFAARPAQAQDATWVGATNSYTTPTNWDTNSVPTGTAFFGGTGTPGLSIATLGGTVGGWTLNSGAQNYTFNNEALSTFSFTGAGIIVNGGSATITNIGQLFFDNASTAGNAMITNDPLATVELASLSFRNTSTAGNATIINNRSLFFQNSSTAGDATIVNSGSMVFQNTSRAGNAAITVTQDGELIFENDSKADNATIINNGSTSFFFTSTADKSTITNNDVLTFAGASTAGNSRITNNQGLFFVEGSNADNATITNNFILLFQGDSTAGNATITNNLALGFGQNSKAGAATIITNSGGNTQFLDFASGGTARFVLNGTGSLDISGLKSAGTRAGSIEGSGNVFLGSKTLAVGGNNLSTILGGVISDCTPSIAACEVPGVGGSLTKEGTGTLTLTGVSSYTGATNVSAGALIVNGSIASSSGLTVDAGALVGGTGTLPSTTINGTLSPGNSIGTITVNGNLAFGPGGNYLVEVSPGAADRTNVTGTATLAGTVLATFAPGSYLTRQYTILQAGQGVSGTFASLSASAPANFNASLSYDANNVFLNLTAALGLGAVPGDAQDVGAAINAFFNQGGTLPPAFVALFGLTGTNLANALEQISGEAATGAQKVGFQLTDQFLNLMLDPFVDGRGGVGGADRPALGFAPGREALPDDIALAYSKVLKAAAITPPVYEPRWTMWGGAYGGSNKTSGDLANIGSHDLSARTVGFAGGFDYHLSRDSVVGLAFAGGGTSWSLAQGLGGGKSDAFQAGVYGATKAGPAYLAAAFAFANHWMSTDRLAFGDHLTADFNAQSYGGRLEGGYRFGTPYGGIAPYAAIQAQSFHTPGYSETGLIPNGFALAFNSRDATNTRSELGARFDRAVALYANAVLALRGRVAWAHDWVSDPTLTPLFQTLPGASFIVNGALPAQNSTLVSAGGELRLANGVTLLAKFDGEFASHSSTYGGTGTFRYRW
jgi:autotransporter-associated beta strand protein